METTQSGLLKQGNTEIFPRKGNGDENIFDRPLKDLLVEYGMGEIYARKGLDQKSRKIATIASLITSGNTPQIKWHIAGGLESGMISKEEVEEVIIQMVLYIGFPQTLNAMKVAKEVFKEAGLE